MSGSCISDRLGGVSAVRPPLGAAKVYNDDDTEVRVLIPEPQKRPLASILAEAVPAGEVFAVEELAELVHGVRAGCP